MTTYPQLSIPLEVSRSKRLPPSCFEEESGSLTGSTVVRDKVVLLYCMASTTEFLRRALFLPMLEYLFVHVGCGYVEPLSLKGIAVETPLLD